MVEKITDKNGRTIKVHITETMYIWEDREPTYVVPIGNCIGNINIGYNYHGSLSFDFYCGWDQDLYGESVVIWESTHGDQMQDDIERLFLRAAIFYDEQEFEFDCSIPELPYAQAGVCAIIKHYRSVSFEDSYTEDMNHFNNEYQPFVSAIMNKTEIPCWGIDEEDED